MFYDYVSHVLERKKTSVDISNLNHVGKKKIPTNTWKCFYTLQY